MAVIINIRAKDGASPELLKAVKAIEKTSRAAAKGNRALVGFAKAFIGFQATRILTQGLSGAIEKFRQFELSLAKIRAVSGASQQDLSGLTKIIKDLGRQTIFTASQVSDAALNLTKLGFSAQEVGELLPQNLALAQASGEELAETAEILAGTMRAFQVEAEDAGSVSDLMAKSFASSSLNLEKFGVGMRNVSALASALGVGLGETTAALAVLTDRNQEAGSAGAGLRFAMAQLTNQNSKLVKALDGASLRTHTFTELLGLMEEKGLDAGRRVEQV